MCQVLPMVPAAEGHQVDQLEPASLPTDYMGEGGEQAGGREGDVCCGRIETDEKKVGKEEREKELIQESETDEGGDVVPGHSR